IQNWKRVLSCHGASPVVRRHHPQVKRPLTLPNCNGLIMPSAVVPGKENELELEVRRTVGSGRLQEFGEPPAWTIAEVVGLVGHDVPRPVLGVGPRQPSVRRQEYRFP